MSYSTGILKHKISVLNRTQAESTDFGLDASGITWECCGTFWAAVDWARGMRALNAGAVDSYAVVLVRMRWNNAVNMRSRIVYDGDTYQVLPETFHADQQANTIQFNAQAIIND